MLKVIERSSHLIVSVDEAKTFLRAEQESDPVILGFIRAAIDYLEEATKLSLNRTTYEFITDSWCDVDLLPRSPVRDVEQVTYLDEEANVLTLATDHWTWYEKHAGAAVVYDRSDFPSIDLHNLRKDLVRIQFVAGFSVENETGVDEARLAPPEQLRHAVLLLTAYFYEHRNATSEAAQSQMPFSLRGLIDQLRVFQ